MNEMTYEEAVAFVMHEKGAAYTFIPEMRGAKVVGGGVYLIVYDENYEAAPEEYFEFNVYYSGGLFQSSSGEEETYAPDDVPEDARSARYIATDPGAVDALDSVLEMLLLCLEGFSFEEAQDLFDKMTPDQILQCLPKPN